jgi:uncharacterized protein (TIGR03083 family)
VQVLDADPLDVRALMRSERAALLALLRPLDRPEWDASTPCPPWTVHDLVAHVLSSDLGLLSRVRDNERRGWIDAAGRDLVELLACRNQQWVDACGLLSGNVLCNLLETSGVAVDRWAAAADLRDRAEGVSWAGVDAAPVWLCLAREYTERWVHQQQLRDALGRPALDDASHLGAVLDTFKWAIPVALTGTTGILQVHVTGGVRRSWLVDHSGFYETGEPAASVTIAAHDFWRQCTAPRDAVRVGGSSSLADAFARTRAIIV